jgi:hypothetical protein
MRLGLHNCLRSRDLRPPPINEHWRRPPAWQLAADLLPNCCLAQFVEACGDGHSSGFQWWPLEEQCSFAPSPELLLEMI